MSRLSISEAAERCQVSVHTLHYYERLGLLTPSRSANRHRYYEQSDLDWIRILTCLRASGMPIQGLKTFAALVREGETTVPARLEFLEAHRVKVLEQINMLQESLKVVDHKIDKYRNW